MSKKKNTGNSEIRNLPVEDLALKSAMQYFGKELLPYLGIKEKLISAAPTEQVELLVRHIYEDFNFLADDGKSWIHMEFESDSIKTNDLRRFREYEATTSNIYHVSVTTYVVCSSTVKEIRTELNEGINVYRIKVIRLKNENADELFSRLSAKREKKEMLKKEDLVPVLLSPLMSGSSTQKDRIIQGLYMLQSDHLQISKDEIGVMQAVLYILANKFLDTIELQSVKEMISMTRLGQILMEDGIEQGIEKGIHALVNTCQELEISFDITKEKLIQKFEISEEAATAAMTRFWKK